MGIDGRSPHVEAGIAHDSGHRDAHVAGDARQGGHDSAAEASLDAGMDAGHDAGEDAGRDAGTDAHSAADTGSDAHDAGCTESNQCPGTTTDCQHPVCTPSGCSTSFTASGTATTTNPPQVAGDCKQIVCDGSGGTMTVNDDADVATSGTVCITDGCSSGRATQTINPGLMCGGTVSMPELCSQTGACGCQEAGDCTPPETCGGGNPGTPLYCGCTTTTCVAENRTCGTASDGCFGTLVCNNGRQDGTETDIDCGGVTAPNSTCGTTCGPGKKCDVGADCTAGFCVDGVCCNSPCTGMCMACSAAKKGQGSDGTCGLVVPGTDPDGDCPGSVESSCGNEGGCNAVGQCTLWPPGTPCAAAACESATVLKRSEDCNGSGGCAPPVPATQDCTPYLCSAAACTTSCVNDLDCAPTAYCTPSSTCAAKLGTGSACATDSECANGFCADGFCCNVACSGNPCLACAFTFTSQPNGQCADVTPGDGHGSCATCTAGGVCGP